MPYLLVSDVEMQTGKGYLLPNLVPEFLLPCSTGSLVHGSDRLKRVFKEEFNIELKITVSLTSPRIKNVRS